MGENYNLFNRNCEHFANMIAYGINYSDQIEKRKELIKTLVRTKNTALILGGGVPMLFLTSEPTLNNGKGSTIRLASELKETYDKLGYTRADHKMAKELEARIVVHQKIVR